MYAKVLCAADFTQAGTWAIETACELARREGAELLVCHVIDSPYRYARHVVYAEPGSTDEVVMGPEVRRRYEERLLSACTQAGAALDGRVRLVVDNGAPEVEILRLARREAVGLIVLGQGAQTAPRVVARARCPVLLATGAASFVLAGAAPEPLRQAAAA